MGQVASFLSTLLAMGGSAALTYYLMAKQQKRREKEMRQYEKALSKYGSLSSKRSLNGAGTGTGDGAGDGSAPIDGVDEEPQDLIAGIMLQLWEHAIQPAASAKVLSKLEPILKDKLPETGPLSKLKVTKCDLGNNPILIRNTVVHEVSKDGNSCQFDMDILWDGNCEIQFDCPFGKFGIRKLKLFGRMSMIMQPLTKVLPCFGGLSYAFLNPPHLSLEFTGLASVAEFSFIEEKIQSTIQEAINGMLVLPARMQYKMDDNCPLMDMYPPPLSILRLSIPKSSGFVIQKQTLRKDDIPDCYCKVQLGNRTLRTITIPDHLSPDWKHLPMDFILSDYDQVLDIHVWDEDKGPIDDDDDLGATSLTIRELLMAPNRTKELPLIFEADDGTETDTNAKIVVTCEMIPLIPSVESFPTVQCTDAQKPYLLNGFLSVMITQAFDIPLAAKDANTFVHVETTNGLEFDTGMVKEAPFVDPLNPIYDCAFDVPLAVGEKPDVNITLYQLDKVNPDKQIVLGTKTLAWSDMMANPDKRDKVLMDNNSKGGVSIEYGIYLRCATMRNLDSGEDDEDSAIFTTRNTSDGGVDSISELRATKTSIPLKAFSKQSQRILTSTRKPSDRTSSSGSSDSSLMAPKKKKVQLVAVKGRGFVTRVKGPLRKKDIPDVYLKIQVADSSVWKTSVIKDDEKPEWNESKIFMATKSDKVVVSGWDKNSGMMDKDDYYGHGEITIDKMLLAGGTVDIELHEKSGKATGLLITLQASLL